MQCIRRETLYVILPYFNFCSFKKRRELFIEFVERIQNRKNIKIIISECLGQMPLPKLKVWKHIKVKTCSEIWIKESLINRAVKILPSTWEKVAWIDADIQFLNEQWVEDTLESLDLYDIVQMFHSAINLGPTGDLTKVDKGFGYMYNGSGTPYTKNDRYGYWHPGYAWACTKKTWNQTNGLIDWAILGSADRHMAMAFIGKVKDSAPGNIHKNYLKLLLDYQDKVKNLKLSWVNGVIMHHWHGSLANRKYRERWGILTSFDYDPFIDVGIHKNSLVQLSHKGERFAYPIRNYFIERSEDE
jgi:hypothetical protein